MSAACTMSARLVVCRGSTAQRNDGKVLSVKHLRGKVLGISRASTPPTRRNSLMKTMAESKKDPMSRFSKDGDVDVRLRGEAEAPWRPVRYVIYGFSVLSASIGEDFLRR
eukprot:scaffold16157_cov55-Prasinocladus_malaysianus.AAC.1